MHLTPELEAEIEEMMASGDDADPEAVMTDALKLLEERARRLAQLRDLLSVGEEDELTGIVHELTPELWKEIRQSARRRAQAGELPSPHVCPAAL